MTREGSAARLVQNTLTNGGAAVLGVLVFLLLTPFMISSLGSEAYAVFTLALSLSFLGGYAAFTDLGVEAATARYVAEARSERDLARVNQLASTTMLFFALIALVVAPVIAGSSFLLVRVFDVPAALEHAAVVCFAFSGVQLLFELPARTYFAVLEGAQRFRAFQACEILRILSQATMFTLVLTLHLGVGALGGALALSSLFVLLLSHVLAHRVVPELEIRAGLASRAVLRTLLGYGGLIVALRLIGIGHRQMDRVIVGATLGLRFVTIYEVANKVQTAAQMVQSVAASALVPATAYARASLLVLQDIFLRGTTYALAASLPFIGAVAIFAEPLVTTWISPNYSSAAGLAQLFALYLVLNSVLIVGTTMAVALGHVRFLVLVNVPTLLVNLAISLALVRPLGVAGVVVGSIVSFLAAFPLQLRFFLHRFEVTWRHFARRTLVPQLPGLAVQAASAAPLLWLARRSSTLAEVGALAMLSVLLSVGAFLAVGLPRAQRSTLVRTVREAISL